MSKHLQNQESKKKIINFKPGIRKETITVIILLAVLVGVIFFGRKVFGAADGMAFAWAVMGIFMTLSYDMTMEPLKNFIKLVGGNVLMVYMTFLGYGLFPEGSAGRVVMLTVMTLAAFFLYIYLFSSEEYGSAYVPFLLAFSLLLFINGNTTSPSGTPPDPSIDIVHQLFIRMAIYGGAGVVSFALNYLINERKFKKKIKTEINQGIEKTEALISDIYNKKESTHELLKKSKELKKLRKEIESSAGKKLSLRFNKKTGHDLIRVLTILKRINKNLKRNYITGSEVMTSENFELLNDMLESVKKYENDEIGAKEISEKFDNLYVKMNSNSSHSKALDSLTAEMDDFIEGEVNKADKEERKRSVKEMIVAQANLYTFIFALKIALLAAAGVLVVSILGLSMGYMFPLYVGITAQPYIELTRGNARKRIVNTVYAVAIILVAFSVTNIGWVHLLLLVVITLVADMFFQFDYMTMMGSMITIVVNVMLQPDALYSYSFYRFIYIAIPCIALQMVDMLIFPRNISDNLSKQMELSKAANNSLRTAISDDSCDCESIQGFISDKRIANQHLRHTNRYAKNDIVSDYLLADEEWLNSLSMISHRMKEKGATMADVRKLIDDGNAGDVTLTARQHNIIVSLDEVLEDISEAEQLTIS